MNNTRMNKIIFLFFFNFIFSQPDDINLNKDSIIKFSKDELNQINDLSQLARYQNIDKFKDYKKGKIDEQDENFYNLYINIKNIEKSKKTSFQEIKKIFLKEFNDNKNGGTLDLFKKKGVSYLDKGRYEKIKEIINIYEDSKGKLEKKIELFKNDEDENILNDICKYNYKYKEILLFTIEEELKEKSVESLKYFEKLRSDENVKKFIDEIEATRKFSSKNNLIYKAFISLFDRKNNKLNKILFLQEKEPLLLIYKDVIYLKEKFDNERYTDYDILNFENFNLLNLINGNNFTLTESFQEIIKYQSEKFGYKMYQELNMLNESHKNVLNKIKVFEKEYNENFNKLLKLGLYIKYNIDLKEKFEKNKFKGIDNFSKNNFSSIYKFFGKNIKIDEERFNDSLNIKNLKIFIQKMDDKIFNNIITNGNFLKHNLIDFINKQSKDLTFRFNNETESELYNKICEFVENNNYRIPDLEYVNETFNYIIDNENYNIRILKNEINIFLSNEDFLKKNNELKEKINNIKNIIFNNNIQDDKYYKLSIYIFNNFPKLNEFKIKKSKEEGVKKFVSCILTGEENSSQIDISKEEEEKILSLCEKIYLLNISKIQLTSTEIIKEKYKEYKTKIEKTKEQSGEGSFVSNLKKSIKNFKKPENISNNINLNNLVNIISICSLCAKSIQSIFNKIFKR